MPPVIYSFDGINIVIYPNDHEPIHIHAKYGEYETIFELHFDDGQLTKIVQRSSGKKKIPLSKNKKIVKFIKEYHLKIVEKWTQIVILKKSVRLTKLNNL